MSETNDSPSSLRLEPIPRSARPVLENLFQLYVHDFTEYVPVSIGADGRFDVTLEDAWWTAPEHHAYFLRQSEDLAGFVLARRGSRVTSAPEPMDVAEMFVLRGLRRTGLGGRAAHALFRLFPGPWEVRVRRTNEDASRFWSRTIERFVGHAVSPERFVVGGAEREVFRFDGSRVAPAPDPW